MCGITFYFHREGITRERLDEAMAALRSIRHRGPDGEGVTLIHTATGKSFRLQTRETTTGAPAGIRLEDYQDGDANLFLGHRRLSIFDLSVAGHQPMGDEAGNWLTFNGEVYNWPEIRRELEGLGHTFRTGTDTEVILAAYRQWGTECIRRFNGMWAIAFWDNREKKLLLTNDRFGVKGLYYLQNEKEIIGCSEIKGILQFRGRTGHLHRGNIDFFLRTGFLDTDTSTFFSNIHRFPPAHFALADVNKNTDITPMLHWRMPGGKQKSMKEAEWLERYREIFFSGVRLRMRSDAPWGISLSGGLDSSSVVYAGRDLLKQEPDLAPALSTFSCVFPGKEGDESSFIHFIEKDTGVQSHHINPLEHFSMDEFVKHVWHQDYPVSSTSMFAEWCLMKLTASQKVKVLLTGQGGDELFGGYHHHYYRLLRELLLGAKFGRYNQALRQYAEMKGMPEGALRQIARGEVKQYIRYKINKKASDAEQKREAGRTLTEMLHSDFFHLMLPTYLRSEDRDSMAFGVETRVPFLDYRMVELAFSMPNELKIRNGWQKWILREAMPELPDQIRWRKDKKGYSNPQEEWIRMHADGFLDHVDALKELDLHPGKDELKKSLTGKGNNAAFWLASLGIWLHQVKRR